MPEESMQGVEQPLQRKSPLEVAAGVVNRLREQIPSPRQIIFSTGVGLSLMSVACGQVDQQLQPVPPPPIEGLRVPGMDVLSQVPNYPDIQINAPRVEHRVFPARRADGTTEFTLPLRLEERRAIEQDVDIVMSTVRGLIQEDYLRENNVDLDHISNSLKSLDDESFVRWSGRRNHDRIDGDQEQAYFLIPGTSFFVDFVKDRNTGEIVSQGVNFSVDKDGNYIGDYDSDQAPETQDDLFKLPRKLSKSVNPPPGYKQGFSFDKLNWSMQLFPSEDDPEGKLEVQMFMDTTQTPYYTRDNRTYSISLSGSEGGRNSVTVVLNESGRGWALKGKGGQQP